MTNAELIVELRGHIREVPLTLLRDAADALEAAEKMIEELENALAACEVSAMNNEELITELRCCAESMPWCGSCIYRGKNDGISELLNKAADALEATEAYEEAWSKKCERLEQRIAELDAQLPKEGEWLEVHDWLHIPQEERGTYRCSACGQVMKYPWNYCPNCGAKMDGGKADADN